MPDTGRQQFSRNFPEKVALALVVTCYKCGMGKTVDSILRRRVRRAETQRALSVEDIRWLRQMASGKQSESMPDEVLRRLVSLKLAMLERQGVIITPKGRLAVKILG